MSNDNNNDDENVLMIPTSAGFRRRLGTVHPSAYNVQTLIERIESDNDLLEVELLNVKEKIEEAEFELRRLRLLRDAFQGVYTTNCKTIKELQDRND